MSINRLSAGASALAAGLLAALAALALSSGGTNPATAAFTGPPAAAASFGLLRAQGTEGPSPFVNASRFAPGIESASVHSVFTRSGRHSVAATADKICVDFRLVGSAVAGGGCGSVPAAIASGFFTGSHAAPGGVDAGQVNITGLIPDGVKSVDVALTSGKTATLEVRTNIVTGTFNEEPASARFSKADGTVVVVKLGEG